MSTVQETTAADIAALRAQVIAVEAQAQSLRCRLQEAEESLKCAKQLDTGHSRDELSDKNEAATPPNLAATVNSGNNSALSGPADSTSITHDDLDNGNRRSGPDAAAAAAATGTWPLEPAEYERYGRQMIMREVGLAGQLRLRRARVLVVGMGGLGCPAAAYLAGAGVGTLGLVDGDAVETSNLHRQIAHATERVGCGKVHSARQYLSALNPLVDYRCHAFALSAETALATVEQYDLVLDCTDRPASRYLISDACVLAGKPLVSASALRADGQLIVLNSPARAPGDAAGGPCYRCIFPRPPPADSVLSCGDGGVLGPVVGAMGVLQALEAVKLLVAAEADAAAEGGEPCPPAPPPAPRASMLLFSAFSSPPFRQVRMRARHPACAACSAAATVTRETLVSGALDYVAFCGGAAAQAAEVLAPAARVSAAEFARLPLDCRHMLVDVRDATQFAICALPGFCNVPWTGSAASWLERARLAGVVPDTSSSSSDECYVVCRFGNDSQLAAQALLEAVPEGQRSGAVIKDIRGGLRAWRREVDPTWPEY